MIRARYMALPLAKGVMRLAGRRADAIVAVTGAVRDALAEGGAIDPGRIFQVPHPLTIEVRDRPPRSVERRAARSELGLPPEGRWVGFFGGLGHGKGIADVIVAIGIASRTVGAIDLLVTGRGNRAEVGPLEEALGDSGRMHFLGEIPYEHIPIAMTAVDAVVVATRNTVREASSLVLHEALAMGTPGVAYATGGIPELLGGDGAGGLLATPDDPASLAAQVERIFLESGLAERLTEEGIRRVRERCDPACIVASYERLFAGLKP